MQRLTRSARPDVTIDTTGKHQFTENRDGGVEIHDAPVPWAFWAAVALWVAGMAVLCALFGTFVAALVLWVG